MSKDKSERICALNDSFRTTGLGGRFVITQGVGALGHESVSKITQAVKTFDNFTKDNDPYGEHDFGAFEAEGQKLFWKIDYYDNDLRHGSSDASDPKITKRVLTIMLRHEY